ncbi:MAG: nickel-dependent lactate racemase [Candidatus Odinarchaeota archaeon]
MKFCYGKEGIEINLDPQWNTTIFLPLESKPIEDPKREIKSAINKPTGSLPLKDIVKSKINLKQVCIVSSDATRPVPSRLILEVLVDELNKCGILDNQIIILIATGLHRPCYENELIKIVGKNLKKRIRVINHQANDIDSLYHIGYLNNENSLLINKYYFTADLKILTGYVEPHFFFGFSGGRKSIVPGIAGAETIQINHCAKHINSPNARFGIYKENPLHKNAIEISKFLGADLIVNVCINEFHEIVQVAAGDLIKAHERLVDYQKRHIFREIKDPFDIVICGNGGYPLDLNLYQAVKSIAIGEMAVKKGGTIIAVNECIEGIGIGQDKFKELLFSGMAPGLIHKKILNEEIVVSDQWEIQVLARILMKADIFLISKLNENEIGNIGLKYAKTVEEAIKISLKKHGPDATILILPNGPLVLPVLKSNNPNK